MFIAFQEFGNDEPKKVIYFEAKEYQRKGMSRKFYAIFENDKPYFELKNIMEAYQHLEADHRSSLVELQENFYRKRKYFFCELVTIFLNQSKRTIFLWETYIPEG